MVIASIEEENPPAEVYKASVWKKKLLMQCIRLLIKMKFKLSTVNSIR
jgi:hypothetical protein